VLINDMLDYLSSGGVGTAGTDLFGGLMPAAPDQVTTVYETGGRAPARAMHSAAGQASMTYPHIQVVVRGGTDTYEVARAVAQKAFLLLDGLPHRTINTTCYLGGESLQAEPFLLGRDEQNRPLVACNFEIAKRLATTS
jgi:hypothetical protein